MLINSVKWFLIDEDGRVLFCTVHYLSGLLLSLLLLLLWISCKITDSLIRVVEFRSPFIRLDFYLQKPSWYFVVVFKSAILNFRVSSCVSIFQSFKYYRIQCTKKIQGANYGIKCSLSYWIKKYNLNFGNAEDKNFALLKLLDFFLKRNC